MRRRLLVVLSATFVLLALFGFARQADAHRLPGEACKNEQPLAVNKHCGEGHGGGNPGECSDGVDNDGDGLTDGEDPDCAPGPVDDCANGIDDDADGSVDEAADCADGDEDDPNDPGGPVDDCANGIDDDADGSVDEAADCADGDEDDPNDPVDVTCRDGLNNDPTVDEATDSADPECQDPNDGVEDGSDASGGGGSTEACVATEDAGLLTEDSLGETLWDAGLNALSPLTEDPEHNGVISGPLNDALDSTPLEVVGDEATCLVDLLLDETVSPVDL